MCTWSRCGQDRNTWILSLKFCRTWELVYSMAFLMLLQVRKYDLFILALTQLYQHLWKWKSHKNTSIHSSRMCTVRGSNHLGGGVGECTPPRQTPPGRQHPPGRHPAGRHPLHHIPSTPFLLYTIPPLNHTLCLPHTPPLDRMIDASENITLRHTSYAGGNKRISSWYHFTVLQWVI